MSIKKIIFTSIAIFVVVNTFLHQASNCVEEKLSRTKITPKSDLTTFYGVSYAFINESREPKSVGVKQLIMNRSSERPIKLIYYPHNFIEEGSDSALMFVNNTFLFLYTFRFNQVEVGDVLKNNVKCAGDSSEIDFYVATSNYSTNSSNRITNLQACTFRAATADKQSLISMRKAFILFIEGNSFDFDFLEVENIFGTQHQMIDLNYTFLEGTGFCSCSDALNYECYCKKHKMKVGSNFAFVVAIILFLSIVIVILIWPKIESLVNAPDVDDSIEMVDNSNDFINRQNRNIIEIFHGSNIIGVGSISIQRNENFLNTRVKLL